VIATLVHQVHFLTQANVGPARAQADDSTIPFAAHEIPYAAYLLVD
jgi:hypothetical protein